MTSTRPVNMAVPQGYPAAAAREITVLGNLELYGQVIGPIWTRLAYTARAGDTIITVRQSIFWNVGDEIVITTTDTDVSHTERHRIARIFNSTTLQLANPLAYTHLVVQEVFPDGRQIDIAAAVGRLTRNIRIQGVVSSSNYSGFNIYVAGVLTFNFNPWRLGTLRLSHVQLSGFGVFNDATNERYAGIYFSRFTMPSIGNPWSVDGCSFVDGFNTA